ncbi:MAG: hypothetical protein CSA32_05450 [Desulfobulbus propionicus]|nr:MAG: hypothetical protein CSA32_05450 [Desulfobulbus propionicus]
MGNLKFPPVLIPLRRQETGIPSPEPPNPILKEGQPLIHLLVEIVDAAGTHQEDAELIGKVLFSLGGRQWKGRM